MSLFRIDRLLTLYLFYPLTVMWPKRMAVQVPILMYHSISDGVKNAVHQYYQTDTSPQVFAAHMKFLDENKYSVISLQDASKIFNGGNSAHIKPVIITFDDGFADFHSEALPILSQYEFCATVFLPTKFVSDNRTQFKGKYCLTWREVLECQSEGVRFGSHTVTHQQLASLTKRQVVFELKRSKEIIEDKTGETVESLSYPYAFPFGKGDFTGFLYSVVKNSGYRNGVTSIIGTTTKRDNPYFMKRLPVNSHDDLRLFRAKLERGYNWLHSIQYLKKKLLT